MDPGSTEPSQPRMRRFQALEGNGAAVRTVEVYDEQERALDVDRLGQLALHTLDHLGVGGTQVDITLVDVARISELNHEHMDSEGPTDVLAFPMDAAGEETAGVPSLLGDIVICPDVAAQQAPAAGKSERSEIELLLVHGMLHLLGHDHAAAPEREVMFSLTDQVLRTFTDTDATGASDR